MIILVGMLEVGNELQMRLLESVLCDAVKVRSSSRDNYFKYNNFYSFVCVLNLTFTGCFAGENLERK